MKRKPPNAPPPARGDAVRAAFEDALRRMAGQTPFEKLTVRGISRAAGCSTRTFYNRWKSKYDLVIRYYAEEDFAAIRAGLAGGPLPTYENLLRRAIRRLRRDRRMFLGAFRDMTGPESFAATFLAHACRSTPVYIRMRTGRDMPSGLAPVLRHYYGGMLLVIAEWLASPAPVPPSASSATSLPPSPHPSAPSSSLPPVHPPSDTRIAHSFLNLVPPLLFVFFHPALHPLGSARGTPLSKALQGKLVGLLDNSNPWQISLVFAKHWQNAPPAAREFRVDPAGCGD